MVRITKRYLRSKTGRQLPVYSSNAAKFKSLITTTTLSKSVWVIVFILFLFTVYLSYNTKMFVISAMCLGIFQRAQSLSHFSASFYRRREAVNS